MEKHFASQNPHAHPLHFSQPRPYASADLCFHHLRPHASTLSASQRSRTTLSTLASSLRRRNRASHPRFCRTPLQQRRRRPHLERNGKPRAIQLIFMLLFKLSPAKEDRFMVNQKLQKFQNLGLLDQMTVAMREGLLPSFPSRSALIRST